MQNSIRHPLRRHCRRIELSCVQIIITNATLVRTQIDVVKKKKRKLDVYYYYYFFFLTSTSAIQLHKERDFHSVLFFSMCISLLFRIYIYIYVALEPSQLTKKVHSV